jgi:hypothetical protein
MSEVSEVSEVSRLSVFLAIPPNHGLGIPRPHHLDA